MSAKSGFGGALLVVLLGVGVGASACTHIPDAAEEAELANLRKDFACDPSSKYRPVPLVAKQDVPLLPRPIKRVWPEFPRIAIDRVKYAEVQALLHVNASGFVERVDIVSETPRGCTFAEASIESLMQWQIEPGHAGLYSVTMKFYID